MIYNHILKVTVEVGLDGFDLLPVLQGKAPSPRREMFWDFPDAYQAARVGAHSSLAIWGGNNELEPAFSWFPESRANEKLFAVDYAALFIDVVHKTLKEVHPGVAFIDSSPTNCSLSEEPYVKR